MFVNYWSHDRVKSVSKVKYGDAFLWRGYPYLKVRDLQKSEGKVKAVQLATGDLVELCSNTMVMSVNAIVNLRNVNDD